MNEEKTVVVIKNLSKRTAHDVKSSLIRIYPNVSFSVKPVWDQNHVITAYADNINEIRDEIIGTAEHLAPSE